MTPPLDKLRLEIDPASVRAARSELRRIASCSPIAAAAVEGLSDWQAIEAMERLWAAGCEPARSEVEASGS